ncbi:MAG: nucleoside hydrolase [Clostridiales bacterium]|nr:nucleoside hydrolase [Clostridiales bacterium]MDY3747462.1 nucleoside hydrolase [Lachnospiraceae bacterium]
MNSTKKVIIDCDPGIDDSLALMLALDSPELEIAGITVVCGNVPTKLGCENVLKVLNLYGREDVPVYRGEEKPLSRMLVTAQDTHGMDGLGETGYEVPDDFSVNEGAVDFLIETLKTSQDISIIALGPLTNIACALKKCPEAFKNLKMLVTMGGSYKSHGNCSPVAEFNYWVDPEAAGFVYENLKRPIHMVGLDVTRKIVLTPDLISLICRFDDRKSWFVTEITKFYVDFHWNQEQILGCVINDPLAVAYFIDPSLCEGIDAYTAVETEGMCAGQTVVDAYGFWKKTPNAKVLTETDTKAFMTMFLNRLFPGRASVISKQLDTIYPSFCKVNGGGCR